MNATQECTGALFRVGNATIITSPQVKQLEAISLLLQWS